MSGFTTPQGIQTQISNDMTLASSQNIAHYDAQLDYDLGNPDSRSVLRQTNAGSNNRSNSIANEVGTNDEIEMHTHASGHDSSFALRTNHNASVTACHYSPLAPGLGSSFASGSNPDASFADASFADASFADASFADESYSDDEMSVSSVSSEF
jgi:hypothetical protein